MIESFREWSLKSLDAQKKLVEREMQLVVADQALAQKLSGSILLQVEGKGEAWYVNPIDLKKYYLGRPRDLINLITALGEELTNEEMIQYLYFDKIFPIRLKGKIVYDQDNVREAYYVHPVTLMGYSLAQPEAAVNLILEQGLGISNEDIRKIEVGIVEE